MLTVYKDNAGKWRWHVKALNGRIIAASTQGYKSKWYCKLRAKVENPGRKVIVLNTQEGTNGK